MLIRFSLFLILIKFIISSDDGEKLLKFRNVDYFDISGNQKITIENSKRQDIIFINIFSINCNINIVQKDNPVSIIHSFNNDSLSIQSIRKDYLVNNEHSIGLQPIKEDFQTCHLIVNTFSPDENKLKFQKNGPTIFFFDKTMDHIELRYNYKNAGYASFSFLFNDIATFKITILKDRKEIKEKIISSSSNIFLSFDEETTLTIKIARLEINNNNPVLMKFGVFTNNSEPFILQRNYLNYGFTTSTSKYQYYYMKIFKDEIGEIVLHDKRQNGILMGKIIQKENFSLADFEKNPDYENRGKEIHYNLFHFDYRNTSNCEEGCNLLITYINEKNDNQDIVVGYEFTLLSRIWNKKNIHPPIINIPYNEYIFGEFDLFEVKYHYYSIFITNETDKIDFEIKGNNFKVFMDVNEERKKPDVFNPYHIIGELNITNYKDVLEINVKEYRNKYINFVVCSNELFQKVNNSFYYFRIFQLKENDDLILPLDSNIANVCRPKKGIDIYGFVAYYSYFLLKNEYNESYFDCSVFSSNSNEKYMIQLINLDKNEKNFTQKHFSKLIKGSYLDPYQGISVNIEKNISLGSTLIIFSFYSEDIFEISSNYANNEKEIYPQIYSSGIYRLNSNKTIKFNDLTDFSLTISGIYGGGIIKNFMNENMTMELNKNYIGKSYSKMLENDSYINIIYSGQFALYMELKYFMETNYKGEIVVGEPLGEMIKDNCFPIYFKKMTSSSQYQVKKKNLNEKELIEFFYAVEDRFNQDESKIREFIDIINQEGTIR